MIRMEVQRDTVYPHEIAVISGYADSFLLPVSVVEEGSLINLIYSSDGHVPLCAYGFRGELRTIFSVIRAYLRCVRKASDKLIRCSMICNDGAMIFIEPSSGDIKLVFGRNSKEEDNHYSDISRALMPLLLELSQLNSIVGAKSAMSELAKKIKARNPGYNEALMLIEQCERKWNIMQPVGI